MRYEMPECMCICIFIVNMLLYLADTSCEDLPFNNVCNIKWGVMSKIFVDGNDGHGWSISSDRKHTFQIIEQIPNYQTT